MIKNKIFLITLLIASFSTTIITNNKNKSQEGWFSQQWNAVKEKVSNTWKWIVGRSKKNNKLEKKEKIKKKKKISEQDKQLILKAYKLQKLTKYLKNKENKIDYIKRIAISNTLLKS